MTRLRGAGSVQIMSLVSDYIKNTPKAGEPSESEQAAILSALLEPLPEKERVKYKIIMNTIKVMSKANI